MGRVEWKTQSISCVLSCFVAGAGCSGAEDRTSEHAGRAGAAGGAGVGASGRAGNAGTTAQGGTSSAGSAGSGGAAGVLAGAGGMNSGGANRGGANNGGATGGTTGGSAPNAGSGGSGAAAGSVQAGTGGAAGSSAAAGSGGSTGGSAGDTTLVGVETPGANCTVPPLPAFDALAENPKLPDPFKKLDGTRVSSRAEWVCRHREISALVQHYETGPKQVEAATVTGSLNGNTLKVDVSGGAADVSFNVTIDAPSGAGPFPALIGLKSALGGGAGSLDNNRIKQLGVAIITYDHNGLQPEGNRNSGLFNRFHGAPSGALIAWAWGASRIIDALEKTPTAKIDPARLGITGCSRDGKAALMIGAMDSRFALTIPQESGSGGVAAWRVSEVDNMGRTGSDGVQNLSRTYSEQQWFGTAIEPFGAAVTKLPLDHHELVAMVAPRGLLILGNLDYVWLSTNNADQAGGAARLVYEALGAKTNIGYVDSGHGHCGTDYGGREQAAIDAYVKRFLVGDTSVNTDFWDPRYELDKAKWVDWEAPNLE